jgi:hypothetical protein
MLTCYVSIISRHENTTIYVNTNQIHLIKRVKFINFSMLILCRIRELYQKLLALYVACMSKYMYKIINVNHNLTCLIKHVRPLNINQLILLNSY